MKCEPTPHYVEYVNMLGGGGGAMGKQADGSSGDSSGGGGGSPSPSPSPSRAVASVGDVLEFWFGGGDVQDNYKRKW